MTNRIANKDARNCVAMRKPFKGSNLFAESIKLEHCDVYIVYSYGYHFPLYAAITDHGTSEVHWFKNCDSYSTSTAKHFTQCNPYKLCIPVDTKKMQSMASKGAMALLDTNT